MELWIYRICGRGSALGQDSRLGRMDMWDSGNRLVLTIWSWRFWVRRYHGADCLVIDAEKLSVAKQAVLFTWNVM
jgi:hypothetical protein